MIEKQRQRTKEMMKNGKRNFLFYITLAVTLALPMGMTAQEKGLFSTSPVSKQSTNPSGLMNQEQNRGGVQWSDGLGNQGFNQQAPLGSGVLMLIAAGAGYAVLKSKKNNK